ncbi:Metallo-dependent phosphatase-like protein [Gigaspora rosea]|uniref:Metallo-dependent phosphatase-like protein n=1 Tax=Gigaspora rosea TaxID=44941 RepID=A0A397VLL7_9GLOM|nr:Metallo-dependent phosphatase-like protein [Gigaspora rosea]
MIIQKLTSIFKIFLVLTIIFPIIHFFQFTVGNHIKFLHVAKYTTVAASEASNQSPRRIIAVGDLHGDYEQTLKVLKMTRILDAKENWIGNNGILVQTGDIVDRGPDCLKIYKLFDRLRQEASKVGGQVINLIGNHEIMNLVLSWSYVTPGDISSFGTAQNRVHEFSSEGYIGNLLLTTFQIASIVENDTLFVHGGIDIEWAKKGIENINILGKELVNKTTKMLSRENPTITWNAMNVTKEEASIFLDVNGPLWMRKYAEKEDEYIKKMLDEVLEILKVKRMVIGHTPLSNRILSKYNGKVYVIDVGISSYYGGNLAALEIVGDQVKEIYPDGMVKCSESGDDDNNENANKIIKDEL